MCDDTCMLDSLEELPAIIAHPNELGSSGSGLFFEDLYVRCPCVCYICKLLRVCVWRWTLHMCAHTCGCPQQTVVSQQIILLLACCCCWLNWPASPERGKAMAFGFSSCALGRASMVNSSCLHDTLYQREILQKSLMNKIEACTWTTNIWSWPNSRTVKKIEKCSKFESYLRKLKDRNWHLLTSGVGNIKFRTQKIIYQFISKQWTLHIKSDG